MLFATLLLLQELQKELCARCRRARSVPNFSWFQSHSNQRTQYSQKIKSGFFDIAVFQSSLGRSLRRVLLADCRTSALIAEACPRTAAAQLPRASAAPSAPLPTPVRARSAERSVPHNPRELITAGPGRAAPHERRQRSAARPALRRLKERRSRRRAPHGHGRQGGGGARRSPAAAPPPSSGMPGCLRARQERRGAERRSGPQRVPEPAASSPARRLPRDCGPAPAAEKPAGRGGEARPGRRRRPRQAPGERGAAGPGREARGARLGAVPARLEALPPLRRAGGPRGPASRRLALVAGARFRGAIGRRDCRSPRLKGRERCGPGRETFCERGRDGDGE